MGEGNPFSQAYLQDLKNAEQVSRSYTLDGGLEEGRRDGEWRLWGCL